MKHIQAPPPAWAQPPAHADPVTKPPVIRMDVQIVDRSSYLSPYVRCPMAVLYVDNGGPPVMMDLLQMQQLRNIVASAIVTMEAMPGWPAVIA